MGRWEPNARGRLARAALELFAEHGYEQTTVAGIAGRAGLTERTFFRHYADKREVLFTGSAELEQLFVGPVAEAALTLPPVDALLAGLDAVSAFFVDRRDYARRRQTVIAANAELRERELIKMASLTTALADALRGAGVADPAAGLTAEVGVAVFRVGFERWIAPGERREMAPLLHEALTELKTVAAGGGGRGGGAGA
ncbi:TetR/AcrR family transcriptional regulator [Streptomyces sp. J2-1]|uniref:TetR/AcrR family transcriptional regulator n=1 Tax=Streptomyces corallincola TaxID=2851888 RepID=UPI001C381BE4|nr:TetR/AcrR family transcriptional regulator [Streptomyces corallincola]MBV2354105.1 TetR/AcrR family transcriptional regulator [Streptomyces corallincola]